MYESTETPTQEAAAPAEAEARPSKWTDAQFREVTRERDEQKRRAREYEAQLAEAQATAAKVQAEMRRKSLEFDVLAEVPPDAREAARHMLLGVAVDKGMDFSKDLEPEFVGTVKSYVAAQFARSVNAQSPAPSAPAAVAPPTANPASPSMISEHHDWSKQETLHGLTNEQRLQFAKKNPAGYMKALKLRR